MEVLIEFKGNAMIMGDVDTLCQVENDQERAQFSRWGPLKMIVSDVSLMYIECDVHIKRTVINSVKKAESINWLFKNIISDNAISQKLWL